MVSMMCGNSIKTGNPHLFQVQCQIKSKLLQLMADRLPAYIWYRPQNAQVPLA